MRFRNSAALATLGALGIAAPAAAQEAALDTGDTAWILTSSALVLFMTIPGLSLFYAGLVRTKNVLSVLTQCLALTALGTLLWLIVGYSLAFGDGNAFIGGFGKAFARGIEAGAVEVGHDDPVASAAIRAKISSSSMAIASRSAFSYGANTLLGFRYVRVAVPSAFSVM